MDRIPVILVTGFLGSGKTTFLRRLAEAYPELSLLFLVNEFAESALDAEVLGETGLPTRSVVGGSLFCECKAGEFVKVMKERVLELHRERNLDAVIIETSGIADPEAIGHLMEQHGLETLYAVHRIVTIVSPANLHKLLPNLPVVQAQIQTSDLVIINKTDLAGEERVGNAEQTIRGINPDAEIVRACYCQVPFSLERKLHDLPNGALSTCEANPFSVEEVSISGEVDPSALKAAVASMPAEIVRIKGVFAADGRQWLLERTVDGLSLREMTSPNSPLRLILIAHDEHEDLLERVSDELRQDIQSGRLRSPCL